jgi:hypothetical protein
MYSNQKLISAGFPKSAILPSTKHWKKKRSFSSSTSIYNLDNTKTSKKGSAISLEASQPFNRELGTIFFGSGTVAMSGETDQIVARCINDTLSSNDSALSLDQAFGASTGSILDLGNGNNRVEAGKGVISWQTGIEISSGSRLLSGSGNDQVEGSGKERGIVVGGFIGLGQGDDVVEGRSNQTSGVLVSTGGRIDMGSGNDRLTGIGTLDDLSHGAIYSNGWIEMGDGNDEITGTSFMINGAQVGQAQLSMGSGDDKLVATLHHSNAPIDFGSGTDRLFLPSGTYNVSDLGGGFFSLLSTGANEGIYGAEQISGLELIVSKSTGSELPFRVGVIFVD